MSPAAEGAQEARVVVRNKSGLHARPSSLLADAALRFADTQITIRKGDLEVDAKSIMELLLLEASCGTELTIRADGPRAAEALGVLRELFENHFHLPH